MILSDYFRGLNQKTMKKYIYLFVILTMVFSSCETDEGNPNQIIKKEKISGFVQKGPFVSGTTVTMNELNSELVQTGKVFTSTIINDSGLFEVNSIELISSFVEFTSSGFYFNEVSGEISNSPLTLTTLSDIKDRNSININVLTHLEKRRVETLLKEGKSFSESKKQSRDELLSIFSMSLNNNSSFEEFDISKNTEEGGILLGISIILQGNRSVGQLTELLSRIQNDFGNNGKLDDENILKSLSILTFKLDFKEIRENVENRLKKLNNSSNVPDFEKQIRKFLNPKKLNITIEGEGRVEERIITNPSGREYLYSTVVELTPIPKNGWVFDSWGGDLSGSEIPNQITVDGDKIVTVKFKRRDYPLNITIEGEGTVEERIVTNPNGRLYPFQTVVELTPIPKEGWVFDRWGGDLSGSESPTNLTVDKEKNITVVFRQPIFRLGDNGITCICENVKPGEKGFINGVEYEVVDNSLIRKRRDEGVDMTKLCTSLVTDMRFLFSEFRFNQPIGNWDVSNVTNMKLMFRESPFNQPIGDWDVGNVTDMSEMFWNSRFNQSIKNWNVSKVTNMREMFNGSRFNQPIDNWDVSKVENMKFMFFNSPFNQPIGNWDVGKVTDMSDMFSNTPFNQPIGDWDVSNVTDMNYMFYVSEFNQPIGDWDVSNVTDMNYMFYVSEFNQPLSDWDVSNVTNMSGMFSGSPFNHPIGNWDVSNVTNMESLFSHSPFNQNISKWCVLLIDEEPYLFSTPSPLTSENKPKWGTCPD